MTLDDWLAWLPSLSSREIDLGLDRVREVYDRLNLERPRRVITVGGTNGKGSSVLMLQALLSALGQSTGAYTSPSVNDGSTLGKKQSEDACMTPPVSGASWLKGQPSRS